MSAIREGSKLPGGVAALLRLRPGRRLGMTMLIALLAFLSLYPVSMLLYGSFHTTPPGAAGTFDLSGYRQVFTAETALVLVNTVGISLAKTVPSLALAVLLAWIIARTDTPAREALETLITLPFFIPPILTAMAWGMLGNPQVGAVNQAWRWITGAQAPLINIYSYGGVIWHMMQYSTPFLFLFIVEAFRAMDPSLEEASRMCGASQRQTLWRITLTLMLPALTTGFLLSFIRGLENFESPLFFGIMLGCPHDSIEQIWHAARLLEGKHIHPDVQLWIFTPRSIKAVADRSGYTRIIRDAGAWLMSDTCPAIGRVMPKGTKVVATDSAKQSHYLPAILGVEAWFGSLEDCVDAALTGRWNGGLT